MILAMLFAVRDLRYSGLVVPKLYYVAFGYI